MQATSDPPEERAPAAEFRRRRSFLGAALVGLALVAGLICVRLLAPPVQHVADFPVGEPLPFFIRGGEMLFPTGGRTATAFEAQPCGGRTRRVAMPAVRFPLDPGGAWVTDTGLLFRTASLENRSPSGTGAFWRHRLWSASLDGSPARELLPDLRMVQPLPSGSTCYWLRPRSATSADLVATPLEGGPSRVLAEGLPLTARLERIEGGVTWIRPSYGGAPVRFVALAPEHRVTPIPDCRGKPDLVDGRLVWLDDPVLSPGPRRLVTAAPDGTDRRVLLDFGVGQEWLLRQVLGAREGGLYVILERQNRDGSVAARPTLCRVGLSGVKALAELRPNVSTTWLDRDHLYYISRERRENWLDWSAQGLSGSWVWGLYRVSLR